jgi:hypothetical protein
MPSPEEIKDLARLYASLTPEQVAAHEDWVRRYKAEQADEKAAAAAAFAARRAELRAMTDEQVVAEFAWWSEPDPQDVLHVLREAGFVRGVTMEAAYRAGYERYAAEHLGDGHPSLQEDGPEFQRLRAFDFEFIAKAGQLGWRS